MSTSPILTQGLGSFSSVNKLPTLGFVAGEEAIVVTYCVMATGIFVPGVVTGELFVSGAVVGEVC